MYNSLDIMEDITQPINVNNINDEIYGNTNINCIEGNLNNNKFDNSVKLRILYNCLFRICNECRRWNFNIELISYKNDKLVFLSNICKLQSYIISCINEEDGENFILDTYIVTELLVYYLVELLCEADFLSITKNYSKRIVTTIRTIPNNEDLIYSYLIKLCVGDCSMKAYEYVMERDIKIRFCNIYTILSQNLLNKLNKEKFTHLLNSLIGLLLTDCGSDVAVDGNTANTKMDESGLNNNNNEADTLNLNNNINSLEGVKCINILLYNRLIEYYEMNRLLIDRLLECLLYVLSNDLRDYRLLSLCSSCFIGVLFFIVYKNDGFIILELITRTSNDMDLLGDGVNALIEKVRSFPKLSYIYTIRSVLLCLHNCHSYGTINIFLEDKLTSILLNCYEIIKSNLLNNNVYIINYSLMQTVQTYTIFLTHNYKDFSLDLVNKDTFHARSTDKDDICSSKNNFDDNSTPNKDKYMDNLIDLSNILINYFTNRIKTINHLSVYIYKKLVQALFSMHKICNNKNSCIVINEKSVLNNCKQQLLINNVLDSMKKNKYIKAKYILLDTIIKQISVEQLLESEPYLLLHLFVNISNNKSTITSLLVHILTQIQSHFKLLCTDNSCNSTKVNDFDCSLSSNSSQRYQGSYELGQTVFKCYLYPILICIINDYKIVNDGVPLVDNSSKYPQLSNFDGCLMPISTDKGFGIGEHDEVVRDRCNCISNILTNLIPNFTFELLKISNEHYRFGFFEFLPQSYKSILNEKVLDLRNFYTNLRQFKDEVVKNIFNKDLDIQHTQKQEKEKLKKLIVNEQEKVQDKINHQKVLENIDHSLLDKNNGRIIVDDRDALMKILLNSKVIELNGIINYCESVCLYNFRKLKKLNFVNLQLEDKCYNGLMICNEFVDQKDVVENAKVQSDNSSYEVYFIDIRRYLWNLYYSDSIDITLNLIKTICDSKKISKLITSNEFLLIKFILKDVIIFINLSNQHYFIQLVQSFLHRLHYNFTTSYVNYVNNNILIKSDTQTEGLVSSNDNSFVDQKIGCSGYPYNQQDSNIQNSSFGWLYLVGNLKDIVEILKNNIEIWNNEGRILISLNLLILIFEMFLMKDKFSKDLNYHLNVFDIVLIESLFKLFYNLKPINYGLLSRVFRFVDYSSINSLVDRDLNNLINLLFHFNGNKYEMSSNIFSLLLNSTDDIRVSIKLLDSVGCYYTKRFNSKFQDKFNKISNHNGIDEKPEININGDYLNSSYYDKLITHINKNTNSEKHDLKVNNKLLVLNRLYNILLDYYNNIDECLYRNLSVSGVVNLISNVLKDIGDNSLIYEEYLRMIYKLFLDMLLHIIVNYMSPNSENEGDMDGKGDRQVDCRGYYIGSDILRESSVEERSNVIIKDKKSDFIQVNKFNQHNFSNYANEQSICESENGSNGAYTQCPERGMSFLSYDIINRNELKLFNYVVYKLVHELIKATETIVFTFTRSKNGLSVDIANGLQGEDTTVYMLDGLIRKLIYCIINCRHVGCNDLFNNLLQFSMEKLISIHNDDGILYRYVYMLIKMIIYNPKGNNKNRENIDQFENTNDKLLSEIDNQLIRSNVIDINTRSEHLSLIFISIIKAEGSKKLSTLNNKIVFILIYILNILEGIEYKHGFNDVIVNTNEESKKDGHEDKDGKKEKFRQSHEFKNDQENLINMINSCYINCNNLKGNNYFKNSSVDKENIYNQSISSESKMTDYYKIDEGDLRKNEKNLISINVLNILRYIYRCIDLKYMNVQNVVDVIKVSLRYLDSNNWSVKNSSSLLLSTILSSLSNKPYFLNSLFTNRTDDYGILGIIKIAIDDNVSVEFYYYTLYLLKVIIESADAVCKEQILLDKDQLNGLKWLLVNNNFYLRKMAAVVLSNYYLHIGIEFKEFLDIGNQLPSHIDDNNYLNGHLLLLKHLLILTTDSAHGLNHVVESDNINSGTKNPIDKLLDSLYNIYRYVNNIENCLLVLEIIKLIDCDFNIDNDLFEISDNDKKIDGYFTLLSSFKHFDILSLYRYYKCRLMDLSKLNCAGILEEEFKNIENQSESVNTRVNIYLITKCIERLIENNEIDIKTLNTLYRLICIFKNYTQLFTYYFISHNLLLQQYLNLLHNKYDINQNHIDNSMSYEYISLLFSKDYFKLVKYCINNNLISNNDVYVNLFKSLLYYFLTTIYFNDLLRYQNSYCDSKKDLKIGINLLETLNNMLLNNDSSELDYSVRIKVSNIYLESFDLIACAIKHINIENVLNYTISADDKGNVRFVEYYIQLLKSNLSLVLVNIMNLLHDDSSLVRYNIKKLLRFFIIDVHNGSYNFSFDIDYLLNSPLLSHLGYELEFLNYIVNGFKNNINIILDILSSLIIQKLTGINNSSLANNYKENTKDQIYSKEETNIYKEDILLINNILLIIEKLMLNGDHRDQIKPFLFRLISYLTDDNKNISINYDVKSINKDKYTMIYTYTLFKLMEILENFTIKQ